MIKLSGINKIYSGDTYKITALKDINLEIEEKEFVAVMGSSGSGKSTLLNIMGFIDVPTDGKFIFSGNDVSKISGKQLWKYRRNNIGFVFQNFALINHCSVFDNVSLPLEAVNTSRKERIKRVNEMLEMVGISELKNKYPGQISGGQKQRVAIARALVGNPRVILADEPTGALDSKTGREIIELLKSINDDGKTIIMVTHDDKIADMTNRKIVLEDSMIVSDTKNKE